MHIGIVGATGRAGALILREAHFRGHTVRAIVRDESRLTDPAEEVIERDALQLQRKDVLGLDVLVSAFGVPLEQEQLHLTLMQRLIHELDGTDVRLLVVGSAGHLHVEQYGMTIPYYASGAITGALQKGSQILEAAFFVLRDSKSIDWTYLAPSIEFVTEGARTGLYRIGDDHVQYNRRGQSRVTYADYASAVVDEAEQHRHRRKLVSVVGS